MRLPSIARGPRATLAVLALLVVLPASSPAATGAAVARLRIPFPQADGTLTPYTFELGYPLVMLVYDSLMWRDARGIPRPWLAQSVSRTRGTVSVRIRRGVHWQDGVALTAADVAFTYRYMATHPNPRFTPELGDLVDVEQTGPDTVVFRLRSPSLGFEDQPLADVPIIPQHLWQGLESDRLAPPGLPVGSGPYRLVSYNQKAGYRFVANPRYFRGAPAVREIDVPIIHDAHATFDALANGTVDAVPVPLTPEELNQVSADLGVRIATGENYTGTVLLLNTAASPFNDRRTRRAVAEALNQDGIAAALGSTQGGQLVIPADRGLLDPVSPWAPRHVLQTYAPDAARVKFAEQGEPPFVILAPNNDPLRLAAGQQVVRALLAVGARATLDQVAPAVLDRAVGVNGYAPSYQAAIWTTPDLVSEDPSFLGAIFGPPLRTPLNYSGYSSSAFDSLAAAVNAAPTVASRRRAVDDELSLLAGDAPAVPLFFTRGAFAYRPERYQGWVYVDGTGILDKQSFLPARGRTLAAPVSSGSTRGVAGQDSGASVLLVFGIGIACLLAVAGAWRLYVRRT
ncbi:MAG: peptide/nickel transport system substrate-binding protein [Solirubrobacteraceae bacterium]|jgi:peptide/nickel transport system substrate-binding protein|nr:peptide/nickel transport system substrate-binding protein [Solirubrobacteraceae bacterium]